ncbi:MAG: hypothetical protein JRJ76_16345 [Deltaproteobacteria bacterium]|nr:hypothetical protein [Deltaproteobacteria bacterium]
MGKVLIQIAHSTQKEIDHPNTPDWVKRQALNLIYTIPVHLTDSELRKLREIEAILAGNGKVENILHDAKHVFEAQKYGSNYFRSQLVNCVGLTPMGLHLWASELTPEAIKKE